MSEHLPDVKVIATPRTDAAVWYAEEDSVPRIPVVDADVSRVIERELADARQLIESEWFNRVTYKQQLRAAQDALRNVRDHGCNECYECVLKINEVLGDRPSETTGEGAK